MRGRGVVIAAPNSGSGKTLATAGLLRAFSRLGFSVAGAKSGPDYIDPGFLAAAAGVPSRNLDTWAMREPTLSRVVRELEGGTELVFCEGAMGLFDGAGQGEVGSTADLAHLTGWPVVLIVDARGMGASAAALLRGFARHDARIAVAGVIFNRVAGDRHRGLLAGAARRHLPEIACLGGLPADSALAWPARHLGLVPSGELADLDRLIERAADAVAASIDLDRLRSLARPATLATAAAESGIPPLGQRTAVARDAAFAFAYPTLLEEWRRAGAALSFFSPLAGEAPDAEADAIYLPGGYPELSAYRIAAADAFLSGLRRAAAQGKVIYGECGGYMVLGDSLIDADGRSQRMAGLLPLVTSFAERRRHLGYREVAIRAATPLGPPGSRFRGHEFHYASILYEGGAEPLFSVADSDGADLGVAGLRLGSVFGSFVHLIDFWP